MNSELIRQENIILDIYDRLYKLELARENKSELFNSIVSMLKQELIKERRLLDKVNSNNLNSLDEVYTGIYSRSILKEGITERIESRVIVNTSKEIGDEYLSKLNEFGRYILSEASSIFLSFLDEYIENEKDAELINKLIDTKYLKIIASNQECEDSLINSNLHTDKSLYLCSDFMSQALGINEEDAFDMKREVMGIFLGLGLKLLPLCGDRFTLILSNLNIRTAFVVANDGFNTNLLEALIKDDMGMYKDRKTKELLETINKDRERHKRVSLIKKK